MAYSAVSRGSSLLHAAQHLPVRVVIADDSLLFRTALSALLDPDDRIDVVGTAATGAAAVEVAAATDAHVVLLDLQMPDTDGLEAVRELREKVPAARVIVLSGRTDGDAAETVVAAGASAFLLKGGLEDEIAETVVAVAGAVATG